MTLLLFYLALAIGVSFICSISEAVLLSIRPSYIASLDQESKTAKVLTTLRGKLDRPLAAILTANTIAHTVGAAGVGAQAAFVFGNEYLGVISGILTFLILVFSEIIPKTLGAVYWQQLAPSFGRLIHWMTILLFPFVWCSEKLTRLIAHDDGGAFAVSRNEVRAMIEMGREEGVLSSKEHKIASNLMKLRHMSVRNIMTPRPVIYSASDDMSVQAFFVDKADAPFSRIPVYGQDRDDILGYVLKTDLLVAQARDEFERRLCEFRRDFLVIPDTSTASKVYDELMRHKVHIALVVDEYGTVQGLVTLEDVVETMVGLEITDESDAIEDMQAHARDKWRTRMKKMGVEMDHETL
ncbi:hemolysin family protein [Terasakiella sp. A23]|uniref:hemolysin family protein n=1 Tax=Terasakiella sp. FCG-A23 TaxID=3080561 RepID=UPI0029539CE9|nr:hemolysin family protein [Terasakiella sp. A23]MDV7338212.1 hemolysin family protein [Terasakiella sp. A23]